MKIPGSSTEFAEVLRQLKAKRKDAMALEGAKRPRRKSLTRTQREAVFRKTEGRCHICGGALGSDWQADHVLAHSAGGGHVEDNYLPAHTTCNNYRWNYLPEEFAIILKLGVWARTQIQRETAIGLVCADGFIQHERNRLRRSQDAISEKRLQPDPDDTGDRW